jgi:hypothetical protein
VIDATLVVRPVIPSVRQVAGSTARVSTQADSARARQVLDQRVWSLFKARRKALDHWRSGGHGLNTGHMAATWRPDATVLHPVVMKCHVRLPRRQ